MEEERILIPIQSELEKFDAHIKTENKYRILFSGKYGSGKTYFLQQYFDINKDKYEVFHLFPTNYAVSSNEDIVKLLQFDIYLYFSLLLIYNVCSCYVHVCIILCKEDKH